jgi:multicomponent Na+:H+ antiporter subunit F
MHQIVFDIAVAWLSLLLGISVVLIVRSRTALRRILVLDMVTLLLVALLVLYAVMNDSGYYLDAALVIALLSFVGTIAAARYQHDEEIF